jgi:hypothetical protein
MSDQGNDFWGKGGKDKGEPKPAKPDSGLRDKAQAEGTGFYAKDGGGPDPADAPKPGGFWTRAEDRRTRDQAEREDLLKDPDAPRRRRRRRLRNILLSLAALVLIVLVVGGALAPTIAGAWAPGYVAGMSGRVMEGKLSVKTVDLSWGGPQRVEGFRLADAQGQSIAKGTAVVEASLWSLIRGNLDLGEVTLTDGAVNLVREADGSTNLQRAVAPPKPAKGTGGSGATGGKGVGEESRPAVPAGLALTLVVKNLDATFTDNSATPPTVVSLHDVDVAAQVAAGKALKAKVTGTAFSGLARPASGTGVIEVDARVERWSREDGVLTPDKAKGEATVTIARLPVGMIDALMGPLAHADPAATPPRDAVTLSRALGGTLDLSIVASGDGQAATAVVEGSLPNARVKGRLAYTGTAIKTEGPLTLSLAGDAVGALVPAVADAMREGATARLDAAPGVRVTIDGLNFPLPTAGLDLRGAAARIDVGVDEMTGQVALEGDQTKPFRVAPAQAQIEFADLAKSLRFKVATSATLDRQAAGDIAVDLSAAGLLDAQGAPRAMPSTLEGSARITGIATAIAQPFVQGLGLNLPADVGPTLDLSITAVSDAKPGGGTAPVALRLGIDSESVKAAGTVELAPESLRVTGDGLRVELARAGAIAARLLPAESGWALSPQGGGGRVVLTVPALVLPLDGGSPIPARATGRVALDTGGLALSRAVAGSGGGGGGSVEVRTARLDAEVKTGGNISATLALRGVAPEGEFTLDARAQADAVITPGEKGAIVVAPVTKLRPVADIEVKNAPAALVRLAMPGPDQPGALDLGRLIAESLGGAVGVKIATKPIQNDPASLDVSLRLDAPRTQADVGAVVSPQRISLRTFAAGTSVSPETVRTLLDAYAPSMKESGIELAGPARLNLAVEPVDIPLDDAGALLLDRVPAARGRISLGGRTIIRGLTVDEEGGKKRPLGPVGVEELSIAALVPVAAMVGPSLPDQRTLSAQIGAGVLGNAGTPIAVLSGTVTAALSSGKLAGPLDADVRLKDVSTGDVERFVGKDGLVTGLLGNTATLGLAVSMKPPAGAAEAAMADADFDASFTVQAPRLRSDGPVRLARTSDRTRLVAPARLTLEPDAPTINQFLAPGPEQDGALRLRRADPITLELASLVLPRPTPGAINPVRPDVSITLTAPGSQFTSADRQEIRLGRTVIAIRTPAPAAGQKPAASQPLALTLDIAEAAVGDAAPSKDMNLAGTITDLFAPDGSMNTDTARLTVHGDLPAVPTALVDAAANRKGLLVEGLGPTIAVKIDADRVPLRPAPGSTEKPQIRVSANSARAQADVKGSIDGTVFRAEEPVRVSVMEMTRAFAANFTGLTPLVGQMEKTKDDKPAVVTASNLVAPINGDMSALNADIRIDPGQCRFETAGLFNTVLKTFDQRTAGGAGTRLQPLDITVRRGVATYGKWPVPVGEFSMIMQADAEAKCGGVDLVNKTVDVVVWIPVGALGDRAMGQLNTGLGSLLSRAPVLDTITMTPWRVKGPLDKPGVSLDAELWAKTAARKLSPERLLREGLGDLFGK